MCTLCSHRRCHVTFTRIMMMVLPSQKGQSPLLLACVGGHTETVKVLLESKLAQVDLQNDVRREKYILR